MSAGASQPFRVARAHVGGPPAVWTAFARQGAWKSWVIAAQFVVIVLLALVALTLAKREPDVVVVQPDGKSQFVERAVAGPELARFLADQKHQPSDLTMIRFTKDFLRLATGVNSTTIEETWPEALSLTAGPLRDRLAQQAAQEKLLEAYKLARIRTELTVEDLVLVERTSSLLHVRATVSRKKFSLADPSRAPEHDRLVHDIVERVIPRSSTHPDGLEILDWRAQTTAQPAATPQPSSTTDHR